MSYHPSDQPLVMGDASKVLDEPMTAADKKRLHDVEHALVKRNARLRNIKKEITKLLGDAIKENESRINDEGGTVRAIERGTYPQRVDCVCMLDETTWELWLARKDSGREVEGTRRKFTDSQIKAHKQTRAQLDMYGEGQWLPIRLPETQSDPDRACDDIDVSELETLANAQIIDLAAVRAMIERDLNAEDEDAADDDGDDGEEDDKPRKRKAKSKDAADASDKPKRKGKTKPELHVVSAASSDDEHGPYAGDAIESSGAGDTLPPSVRVVYVLYVDGALTTLDRSETSHQLRTCAVRNGDANDVAADACDNEALDTGELSTGHKYAICRVADTTLVGVEADMCTLGEVLLGYVVQDVRLVVGATFGDGEDDDTVSTMGIERVATAPQPQPRIKVDMPDELKSEVQRTLLDMIHARGGNIDGRDLLGEFAKASQFDEADVPSMVRDNLTPLCEDLVATGVLIRQRAGDDGVVYAYPSAPPKHAMH